MEPREAKAGARGRGPVMTEIPPTIEDARELRDRLRRLSARLDELRGRL